MNNVTLYSYSSKNKIKIWKAFTDYTITPKGIELTIEWGYQGGALQTKNKYVKAGKNIGKANQTTIQEQADLELQYLYQKQFDDSYVLDIKDYKKAYRPQLAHKYKDKKHTIDWIKAITTNKMEDKYYASKKLNGIRCFIFIEDGKVVKFESRSGKPFKYFNHIASQIVDMTYDDSTNLILDGELFHESIPFEVLASLINSDDYVELNGWKTSDVQFHCYDLVSLDYIEDNFYTRFVDFFSLTTNSIIKKVESKVVNSEADMITLAKKLIEEGYEGLMLRSGFSKYTFGERSINLLKYKIMEQEEFLIKEIYLAANDPTKVQITCYNHHVTDKSTSYATFDVGSVLGNKADNLNKYYNNRKLLENKAYLTIDYQTLSEYKVPLFPVGIDMREGEIVDGVFVAGV